MRAENPGAELQRLFFPSVLACGLSSGFDPGTCAESGLPLPVEASLC